MKKWNVWSHFKVTFATLSKALFNTSLNESDEIKELSQIAKRLSDSRAFLDSVIENIPNMIFVKDAKDLRFVRFNRAGEELLGRSREALIGKNDFDFFPEAQAQHFTEKDCAVLQSKTLLDIPEEPIQTPKGIRYLHTVKIPILDSFGVPLYLLGISEDITERKLIESQRQALIEEQIARKEAEKNAKNLADLAEAATQASRAKSAFIANMSHEIRTPLGAMLGFADLILDEKNLTKDQVRNVSTIIRNGQQLLRIVDEVLDISKVESSHIEIENIPFSLTKLIEEVTSLFSMKAIEKGLKLSVSISSNVPEHIISDPTRLRQILINIIGNAIKFTHTGSVTVEVTMKTESEIEFLVTDTGIGLSEEQASGLFQPFSQADSSMTRRYGGTGLGLFLSRKLANLLHGDVTLKTTSLGSGSAFLITIKAQVKSAETTSKASKLKSSENKISEPLVKSRVLVVDDSEDNRYLVQILLSKAGLTVDAAESAREGIEKALSSSYDVILMDIQMPDMDGFEALKVLRSKNYTRPIIALTAHAMKGHREKFLADGFDDYLCKPISKDVLLNVITRLS